MARGRGLGRSRRRPSLALPLAVALGATLACSLGREAPAAGSAAPSWRERVDARLERIRSGELPAPRLRARQAASLAFVHYDTERAAAGCPSSPAPAPPDASEIADFRALRDATRSEALAFVGELFGERDDLAALAVRDGDDDGIPDFRISDYFGKFLEGDVDADGDGLRNVLDACPFDASAPRAAPGVVPAHVDLAAPGVVPAHVDLAAPGVVPAHVDLAARGAASEIARIQRGLLADHGILLVERDARFDAALAHAVDDAVRRVFRASFRDRPILPTLRTVAVERTALLGPVAQVYAEDHTHAQTFSPTQSLIVYDEGRETTHDLVLLVLVVHEIGHAWHMALDFDADDVPAENARTDFPAPRFAERVAAFGWSRTGTLDGRFADDLPVLPRFAYTGVREPRFAFRGETPEAWLAWFEAEARTDDPESLAAAPFVEAGVVSDYSLTSPYEWYAENLIAYLVSVLEEHALERLAAAGRGADADAARRRIAEALRESWPDFRHRNLAPEVRAHFTATLPIAADDRDALVGRYLDPLSGL